MLGFHDWGCVALPSPPLGPLAADHIWCEEAPAAWRPTECALSSFPSAVCSTAPGFQEQLIRSINLTLPLNGVPRKRPEHRGGAPQRRLRPSARWPGEPRAGTAQGRKDRLSGCGPLLGVGWGDSELGSSQQPHEVFPCHVTFHWRKVWPLGLQNGRRSEVPDWHVKCGHAVFTGGELLLGFQSRSHIR